MALDHMILGGVNYYPVAQDASGEITANGKTWTAHPDTITVKDGAFLYTQDTTNSDFPAETTEPCVKFYEQQTVKCIAKNGNDYAICGSINFTSSSSYGMNTYNFQMGIVYKNDVISEN